MERTRLQSEGSLVQEAVDDDVLARARRKALYDRLESERETRLGEEVTSRLQSWMIRSHRKMRKTFAELDRNGDGTLTIDEAVHGLQGINDIGLSADEIRAALLTMDTDGSGDLDYHEFFEIMNGVEEPFCASVPRLHTLASLGDEKALMTELAAAGGDSAIVNGACASKSNWRGRTPLMTASLSGQLGTVKSLLAAGADPNCEDTFRWTALMSAASNGHAEVCQALCRAGANPDLKNTSGQTAGDLAKLYGFETVTKVLMPYSDMDGAGVPGFLRPLNRPIVSTFVQSCLEDK